MLDFKTRGNINSKYQSRPDNIAGKMTIAALDREFLTKESVQPYTPHYCGSDARRSAPILYNVRSTGSLQNASFSSTSSSVTLTPATTTSFSATVAKSRAPGALKLVQVAGDRAYMIDMHNRPRLPPNLLLLASFDALWRKFGMPDSDEIEHNGPEDRPQDLKELTKWRKELRYMMSLACYRRRERSIGATS